SDMPWPVKNRDVVTHSVVTQDPATKVVSIKIDKAEDIFPKDRDFVRMKKLDAIWQLTPIENDVLRVTYEAHADPGGGLPSWLINSLIVDTPLNTLRNLRKVMIREKYQNTQLDFITN
ncbi:MAG: START domain-containing protein, partial [Oleibacter sp.]|nr:START domain-containing protein [Thalassolituus sp.]